MLKEVYFKYQEIQAEVNNAVQCILTDFEVSVFITLYHLHNCKHVFTVNPLINAPFFSTPPSNKRPPKILEN